MGPTKPHNLDTKGDSPHLDQGLGIRDWGLGRGDCPDFRLSENGTVPFASSPLATPPSSLATSHWPLATSRSAFTLVEMLVVVSIVMILMVAAVVKMQPGMESRRTRDAARA